MGMEKSLDARDFAREIGFFVVNYIRAYSLIC